MNFKNWINKLSFISSNNQIKSKYLFFDPYQVINSTIPIGYRTIKRDTKYHLNNRFFPHNKVMIHLLAGNTDIVKLVHHKLKAVYIGTHPEAVLVDPTHPQLSDNYSILKMRKIQFMNHNMKEFLKVLCHHVQTTWDKKNTSTKKSYRIRHEMSLSAHKIKIGSYNQDLPALYLHDIMAKKAGVCIHYALHTAYLLSRFIQDYSELKGEVYIVRNCLKRSTAHAWVCYKPISTQQLFLVDAYWYNGVVLDLNNHHELSVAKMQYSEKAIETTLERYQHDCNDAHPRC
ncbi:MAG: hypothetical protein A3F12_04570 [Gammaproteobacteria bacterium RIFCSPHIGHO2_12_FULL_38_14]|nr:MAG: hypothetical protein A3F12_04570 [Gammaproteobacteria bacterium RIFCSPHIGHO2_12_FULL_38_14]